MLTLFEQHELHRVTDDFIRQVRRDIQTKHIKRKSRGLGEFSAVVNASGRLADSVEDELYDDGIRVYCLSYIDKLIYGQPPGEAVSLTDIESWMIEKDLDYNPATVAENIYRYGNSIWQKHRGENSGLLSDVNIEVSLSELETKLSEELAGLIANQIIQNFAA
jgi:hypothetical protein